ncbi:MAG: hypothetical protein ACR2HJ_00465 [Fimbriimonadales bacterium]
MRIRSRIACAVFCLAATVAAQKSAAPVTKGEFVVAITKYAKGLRQGFAPSLALAKPAVHGYGTVPAPFRSALSEAVGMKLWPVGKQSAFLASSPATRYEIAVALDRLRGIFEPKFASRAAPKRVNLGKLKGRVADGSHAAMTRLATGGYLPFGSPIFDGPGDTISPNTLSAVLAQFSERLGERFRKPKSVTGS